MFVRQSKYRHVFCDQPKLHNCYTGLRPNTSTSSESQGVTCSQKFVAYTKSQGSGKDIDVIPLSETGRWKSDHCIMAHTDTVLDMQFNPFNDCMLATCAADGLIRLWNVPEGGLTKRIGHEDDALLAELEGHDRKVTLIKFHPTASGALASAGQLGAIKLWDMERGQEVCAAPQDKTTPTTIEWNNDGSSLLEVKKVSGQGNRATIWDARTMSGELSVLAHPGVRSAKGVWLGTHVGSNLFCTVGFTKTSKRQIKIWDARKLNDSAESIALKDIDQGSSTLFPFVDHDSGILYLVGKGSSMIKYYEIGKGGSNIWHIDDYRATSQQKGICMLPRVSCDTTKCQITKFLKLTRDSIEPLAFTVPRRSDRFAPEIYPDTYAGVPTLSANDFFGNKNSVSAPKLVSMNPKSGNSTKRSTITMGSFKSTASSMRKSSMGSCVSVDSEIESEMESMKKEIQALRNEVKALTKRVDKMEH